MARQVVLLKPSDAVDPRNRLVRSPHCPNRKSADPTCGTCAWGFYTKEGEGAGENAAPLTLVPLQAGYKSQCGSVNLYRDEFGRVGALRDNRFYPGITGNEAFERYVGEHPQLLAL